MLLFKLLALIEQLLVSRVYRYITNSYYYYYITGGDDYNFGPYTVTFPAGMTSVPFNVPIIDEMICEGNETFTLTIDSSSLPKNVGVADPGNTTVTIVDNEGKQLL